MTQISATISGRDATIKKVLERVSPFVLMSARFLGMAFSVEHIYKGLGFLNVFENLILLVQRSGAEHFFGSVWKMME
jgi:hypothetical protein